MKNISEQSKNCKCNTCKLSHTPSENVCFGWCEERCKGIIDEEEKLGGESCYIKYSGDIFDEYCKNICSLNKVSKNCLVVDVKNDLCIVEHYNNYLLNH